MAAPWGIKERVVRRMTARIVCMGTGTGRGIIFREIRGSFRRYARLSRGSAQDVVFSPRGSNVLTLQTFSFVAEMALHCGLASID
jgi:hypothetical protein